MRSSSLQVRLLLICFAGLLLAGLVTTVSSVQLFRSFAEHQTQSDLHREARGIAQLYSKAVAAAYSSHGAAPLPTIAVSSLEATTGDLIFYEGTDPCPGPKAPTCGLPRLNNPELDWAAGKTQSLEFVPPGKDHTYLAVARPVFVGGRPIGDIVIAKRKADVNRTVLSLIARLLAATAFGLAVSATAAWYLTRRLTRPLAALSTAADEIAAGHYTINLPSHGPGELGHLIERFDQMAERLAESDAMERNFLMSVSHELRTPLTAIRGHVAALQEGVVEDPEARRESLEVIGHEAARLERLVGDMLDLAKLDARRFTVLREEVEVDRLLDHAYQTFSEEARGRSIDFELEIETHATIVTDGDRVLQIVGNLLSNAFRVTPDGGRITMRVSRRDRELAIAVKDTGPGIPEAEQERLFRAFVSDTAGGTGLGLTIARELAVALRGKLEVESEPRKGATFVLYLPATPSFIASAAKS